MYMYLKRKYTIHYMSIYAWKFGISFLVYTWLLWSPLKGVKQVIKFAQVVSFKGATRAVTLSANQIH